MLSKTVFPALLCVVTFCVTMTQSSLVLGPNVTRPCVCLEHKLTTKKALMMLEENGGTGRFFMMEQRGIVYSFSSNLRNKKLFLNLTSLVEYDANSVDERGLLSFALHPRFAENGRLYTYSIRKFNGLQFAFVTELQEISGRIDISKEKLLMVIQQHNVRRNGGQLLFGKDRYLYIFVGDGGLPSSAQNMTSLLGKVLRINIDNHTVVNNQIRYYSIPDDNPDVEGRKEIYAWGFRNPWRCSLDIGNSSDIFCGDLGEGTQEEVDFIEKGHNYGWDIKEGNHCVKHACNLTGPEGTPIFVYNHTESPRAVIGGYVYRGRNLKNLTGRYVFADMFAKTYLHTIKRANSGGQWEDDRLFYCDPGLCPCHARESIGEDYLVSFSQDRQGEIYLLTTKSFHGQSVGDRLLKIVPPSHVHTVCSASSINSLWTTAACLVISITVNALFIEYSEIIGSQKLSYQITDRLLAAGNHWKLHGAYTDKHEPPPDGAHRAKSRCLCFSGRPCKFCCEGYHHVVGINDTDVFINCYRLGSCTMQSHKANSIDITVTKLSFANDYISSC